MLDRDLLTLQIKPRRPRVFFTESGLAALRQLVLDRRAMDPARFAHLRRELGLSSEDAWGGEAGFIARRALIGCAAACRARFWPKAAGRMV